MKEFDGVKFQPDSDLPQILMDLDESPLVLEGQDYRKARLIYFYGSYFIISKHAELTVNVTGKCNARCDFCSNEATFMARDKWIDWDDQTERTRQLAFTAGISKVSFSGGEPTAHPAKLYELAKNVTPGFTKEVKIHSNGLNIWKDVETETGKKPLIVALKSLGFTGCSLSVAHWDRDTNKRVMRFEGNYQGLTDEEIARFAKLGGENFSPRLSCIIHPDGVWSAADIRDYVSWAEKLGIRQFIFRIDFSLPQMFRKNASANAPSFDLDAIGEELKSLDNSHRWQDTFALHKSDAHVHGLSANGTNVWLDSSGEELDPDKKIRRLIIMPNGVTYTSWINPYSVLFDDDVYKAAALADQQLPQLASHTRELYDRSRKTLSL